MFPLKFYNAPPMPPPEPQREDGMEPLDIAIEALDKIRDTSEEFGISRYAAQISGLLRDARQRDRLLIERLHSSKNSLLDANKNC